MSLETFVTVYGDSTYYACTAHCVDTSGGVVFKRWLLEPPTIIEELPNEYGIEGSSSMELVFTNYDNTLDATWAERIAEGDLRGKEVLVEKGTVVNATLSGSRSFLTRGKVVGWEYRDDQFILKCQTRHDELLETIFPRRTVTTDLFTTTARDVGLPININIGHCKDVPCRHVQEDTVNNNFDYCIGEADTDYEELWVDHDNGRGVKRNGRLVKASEYTFYNGSDASNPFPGFAILRFKTPQYDFSKQYITITADVKGLIMGGATAQRDFAQVLKNILNNDTWGLDSAVDTTAFANATTALAAIGTMYCDISICQQRVVKDIINEMARVARGYLAKGADGEWEMYIDAASSSVMNLGDGDGHYNNCEVEQAWTKESSDSIRTLKVHYDMREYINVTKPYLELSEVVRSTFGVDRIDELPCVNEGATAAKYASYEKQIDLYCDQYVRLRCRSTAAAVTRGQVVTLTAPRLALSAVDFKVIKVVKNNVDNYVLECRKYDAQVYTDLGITPPTAPTESSIAVYGPAADVFPWELKTSDFTAEPNHRYQINTTAGAVTMTMPPDADCEDGDSIAVEDYAGTFATNNLTCHPNTSQSIMGVAGTTGDMGCRKNYTTQVFKYVKSTQDWRVW